MEYAGVAITALVPSALLTGLVAALGPACRLRRRYAHAPAGASSRRRCAPGARLIRACGLGRIAQEAESKVQAGFFRDGLQGLAIKDTGTGIPDDILPHVFEPFFTTKVFRTR